MLSRAALPQFFLHILVHPHHTVNKPRNVYRERDGIIWPAPDLLEENSQCMSPFPHATGCEEHHHNSDNKCPDAMARIVDLLDVHAKYR